MASYKWMICTTCNRVFKADDPSAAERHALCGRGSQKWLQSASWWHCLYQPELFLDWWRLKWQR